MGFRPSPPDDKVESTLVQFRHGNFNGNWHGWSQRLDDYLKGELRSTLIISFP